MLELIAFIIFTSYSILFVVSIYGCHLIHPPVNTFLVTFPVPVVIMKLLFCLLSIKIVLNSFTSGSIFQNINDLYFRQRSFKTKMLIIPRFLSSRLRRVTSRSRVKYGFVGDSVLHKSPSGPGSPAPGGNTRRQGNRASQGLHSSLASVSRDYSIRIWGHFVST